MDLFMNLQYFAEAGTLVNATTRYQNAYDATDYSNFEVGTNDLGPLNKTFYDTTLLDNARDQLIFAQLGKKQPLPKNHGRTVEWRRWRTLGPIGQLTEAVIPTGKKLGMVAITVSLAQYGDYVTISDLLMTHAIDDVVLGATEELGAAAGLTNDELVRNTLLAATMDIFLPVGMTPSVSWPTRPRVFQRRNSIVRPLFAGRLCFFPSCVKISSSRALSSSVVS